MATFFCTTQLFVIDANTLPIEEAAARVVAVTTNTSVGVAIDEVQSRVRRRQSILFATIVVLVILTGVSMFFAIIANRLGSDHGERLKIKDECQKKQVFWV